MNRSAERADRVTYENADQHVFEAVGSRRHAKHRGGGRADFGDSEARETETR